MGMNYTQLETGKVVFLEKKKKYALILGTSFRENLTHIADKDFLELDCTKMHVTVVMIESLDNIEKEFLKPTKKKSVLNVKLKELFLVKSSTFPDKETVELWVYKSILQNPKLVKRLCNIAGKLIS